MKKSKISDIALIILFSTFIILISAVTLIKKPQFFSLSEGRDLAKFPTISTNAVVSGEYFEGIRDFYSDQLALKDSFTKLYASVHLALGDREINGIALCKNGALAARSGNTEPQIFEKNLSAAQKFTSRSNSSLLFVAPDSTRVFSKYLPALLSKAMAEEYSESKADTEFLKEISAEPEKYYYKTDHHWTSEGAYQAYLLICQRLGIDPVARGSFEIESVTKSFLGSSHRRSALPASFVTPDEIVLYRHPSDSALRVRNLVEDTELGGIYDLDELSGADPYRVFLGGNHAHISISTQDDKERPKMLVIKDSFANSLIPFLALHYDLEVIDPRYADLSTIRRTDCSDFDTILLLCSEQTLKSESKYALFINSLLEKSN